MAAPIYFVSLITRDNRPLHIQQFSPYEPQASLTNGKHQQQSSKEQNDNQQQHPDKESQLEASKEDNAKKEKAEIEANDTAEVEENVPSLPSFVDEQNVNELLKYNFLSNMALDVFSSVFYEPGSIDQNCALLFVQDGISVYGYETNTGLKIVIGTATKGEKFGKQLDGIFKNIHKAYLRLICNPFQPLDENSLISSKRLEKSIIEVVEVWNSQQ